MTLVGNAKDALAMFMKEACVSQPFAMHMAFQIFVGCIQNKTCI